MTDHIHQISSRPASDPAAGRLRSLGLDRNPFTGSGPFIPDASRQGALVELRGWVDSIAADPSRQDRLAVITAEPGMGKSGLLRQVAAASGEGVTVALIDPGKGGLTDAQLLRALVDAFGGTATGRTGMDLRRDIRHALADLPEGTVPGLLIDDADYSGSRLELLRNVLRDGAGQGLFILLTGLPDLADRLGRRRSLRAILGPEVRLDAMDASSMRGIIASRTGSLRRSRPLVSVDAIEAMIGQANGNPGWLLRLAELSVEAAGRQGVDQVGRDAVVVARGQMDDTPETTNSGSPAREIIQAEIPLLTGSGGERSSSSTTQRTLWEGGSGDDRVPD